jgi:carbon starvation protein CstA
MVIYLCIARSLPTNFMIGHQISIVSNIFVVKIVKFMITLLFVHFNIEIHRLDFDYDYANNKN